MNESYNERTLYKVSKKKESESNQEDANEKEISFLDINQI